MEPLPRKPLERENSDEDAISPRNKPASKSQSNLSGNPKRRSERSKKKKPQNEPTVKRDKEREREPASKTPARPTSSSPPTLASSASGSSQGPKSMKHSGHSKTASVTHVLPNVSDDEVVEIAAAFADKEVTSQGHSTNDNDIDEKGIRPRRRSENDDSALLTKIPDKLVLEVKETSHRRRSRSYNATDLKYDLEGSEDFKRFTMSLSDTLNKRNQSDEDHSPTPVSKFDSILPNVNASKDKSKVVTRVHARSFSETDSPRHAVESQTPSTLGTNLAISAPLGSNEGDAVATTTSKSESEIRTTKVSQAPPRTTVNDHSAYVQKDRRVKLNVGGQVFVAYASTLAKYPNTLLGAMFHPRNQMMLHENEDHEYFFDRDPRSFEVILNFYRTGAIISPPWLPLELLVEEARFFAIDLAGLDNGRADNRRLSMELMNMEYKNRIADAAVYKKMSRHKLLSDYHSTLVEILQAFAARIERKAQEGHNSVDVKFFSPLHYSKATTPVIFNVISKNEIRELIVELLEEKHFTVEESNEYSKIKTTNIIGLDDQVTNYNDPKFFAFSIRW